MGGQAGDVQAERVLSGTVEAEKEARLQHEDVSVLGLSAPHSGKIGGVSNGLSSLNQRLSMGDMG
ncbi:hypothetical protein IQ07DRAFT_582676 [Pyrenochaeta sp. DS3sAY3a]|nr:hypothetical protein IQ07DRAFT_582676 [Pyrenochaeta sp. DS3sAY3a]